VVIGAAVLDGAKFTIDGDENEVQLIVEGHTGQSVDFFKVQSVAAGQVEFRVESNGKTSSGATMNASNFNIVKANATLTGATSAQMAATAIDGGGDSVFTIATSTNNSVNDRISIPGATSNMTFQGNSEAGASSFNFCDGLTTSCASLTVSSTAGGESYTFDGAADGMILTDAEAPNAAGDISGTFTAGLTIDAGSVTEAMMSTEDFGDFNCAGAADDCLLDPGVVDSTALVTANKTVPLYKMYFNYDTDSITTSDEYVLRGWPAAATITGIYCEAYAGTSFTIKVCDGEDIGDDTCTTNHLDSTESTTLACTAAGASDTTINAGTKTAREKVSIVVTAVSGTVTAGDIYIEGTID
jgi:hypothetical protein